jgi:hypothetical protein
LKSFDNLTNNPQPKEKKEGLMAVTWFVFSLIMIFVFGFGISILGNRKKGEIEFGQIWGIVLFLGSLAALGALPLYVEFESPGARVVKIVDGISVASKGGLGIFCGNDCVNIPEEISRQSQVRTKQTATNAEQMIVYRAVFTPEWPVADRFVKTLGDFSHPLSVEETRAAAVKLFEPILADCNAKRLTRLSVELTETLTAEDGRVQLKTIENTLHSCVDAPLLLIGWQLARIDAYQVGIFDAEARAN